MEIRERTIEEIKKMDSSSLLALYEIVLSMKARNGSRSTSTTHYRKVRKSLGALNGSLSEDILSNREDRL